MNPSFHGFSGLFTLLAAMAFAVQWVASARTEQQKRFEDYRSELLVVDNEVQRIDASISRQSEALNTVEAFYEAWVPEIVKCEDSDALISAMIVDAYALNLVLVKKGVKFAEPIEYRGRSGTADIIELTVAGRYDRLVRYLDRLRTAYPFLTTEKIDFSVQDASVQLTLAISSCQLVIPESDRPSSESGDEIESLQWAEINDEEIDS